MVPHWILSSTIRPTQSLEPSQVSQIPAYIFKAIENETLGNQVICGGVLSPFGIEQISDFLIVDLHVGDLDSEALSFSLLANGALEQRAAEARDKTGLLVRTHHGVRLPWTWNQTWCRV